MISIREGLTAAVRVILLVSVSAGCVAQDRRGEARSIVEDYFAAVRGSDPDRGWSLLHPEIRALVFSNDHEAYRALAAASDWSRFRIDVGEAVADDPSLYFVSVRVPGGPSSVPGFLIAHAEHSLLPLETARDPEAAAVGVRFDYVGGGGIWAASIGETNVLTSPPVPRPHGD